MSKLRSLSTSFWSDPFIEDLTPSQKLLFIYLITNDKTNMLGIYESSIKKISFETGIKKEDINNALKAFERVGKVKYINNYVILTNYMKHQNYNTNMKKSAIDIYNNLPKELKNKDLIIDKSNPLKGFQSLLNHFGMVRKVEVEYELEIEDEKEVNDILNNFNLFWDYYHKITKLPKTDREPAFIYWKKMSIKDQRKAYSNIKPYYDSLKDKKYCKKARTYLSDCNYNDEFENNSKYKYLTIEEKERRQVPTDRTYIFWEDTYKMVKEDDKGQFITEQGNKKVYL